MSVQLTSPNPIRAAKLAFGQPLAWDLENLVREITRVDGRIDVSSGGGSTTNIVPIWTVRTVTASYTAQASDVTIFADATAGALTVTLLLAPPKGRIMNVSKIDATSNIVTLAGNGRNVNGSATQAIRFQDVNLQLQFSGSEWRVI